MQHHPGRNRPRAPGRARQRDLPAPRRSDRGRARGSPAGSSTGLAPCWASEPRSRADTRTSTLVAVTPCRVASVPAASSTRPRSPNWPPGTGVKTPYGIEVRVHLCGVRGSTPAPGAEFVRYGGHTSCVAIAPGGAAPRLVLDAGTGLRQVTGLLRGEPYTGTIILTHLHWDHVHGLPFFTAGDRADARVTLLLPEQEEGAGAEEVLARGMSPPHFPIAPGGLRGRLVVRHAGAGRVQGRGLHGGGAGGPAQGRPDLRVPGQRRAFGDRLHSRSLPHRAGAGPRGVG